jgi:thymidine phosphorylase
LLRVKCIGIDTYGENVAFLSRNCSDYRPEDFQALNKIEISSNGHRILATLNVVDDPNLLPPDMLGLSLCAYHRLNLAEGEQVKLVQATPPASLDAVRAKINGAMLSDEQFMSIIRDVAGHRYSKMEIAAFLISCASFMTTDEVIGLTRAMAEVGQKLTWDLDQVVDKHCIGGIPGNRTSMIVVPIVAAHGLFIPKTSSRSITSPAGTADTMEVLANVDIGVDRMQAQVQKLHGCLAWGGHVNLSPADDILITVERPLEIDTREQLVASILSKKVAAGVTDLVIDIPIGPSAKVRNQADAIRLRKLFEHVSSVMGINVEVVITDGSQPIGFGIGPVLEARDVMAVLRREAHAPKDLEERALLLASHVLEFDPCLKGGQGYARAVELLENGAALATMEKIIETQGPSTKVYALGPLTQEICAAKDGKITAIDCYRIARIARLAGAPMDKGAGIDLFKKIGDMVVKGEAIYRIHSHIKSDFDFAQKYAASNNGYVIE